MNKRTKILVYLLSIISLLSFGYAANEIGCIQSSNSFSSCTTRYIYLYQDNNQNGLPDYSFVPKANYIYDINPTQDYNLIQLMPTTNVQYFMSTGNMLYTKDTLGNIGVMDDYLFVLKSRAFEYKQPIRAIGATKYVNVEIPAITGITGINNPMIGFKYNFVLKKAEGYANDTNSTYRRRTVPSLSYFSDVGVTTGLVNNLRKRSRGDSFNNNTCTNYNIQRCGDKKISTHTGFKINNTFYPVNSWVSTGFTPEVCDSNTETGAACVNGTQGCCNVTCSGFGGGFCGDGIVQEELDEYCDLGPWNEETGEGNNDSYQLSACATFCEFNLEPETLPEELG